ncbi:acyltransferase family protein [Polynucleobacter sp. AP-Nino-20-G2]|uniref:acyltransferase family protein n=1 Tax=Polynucleobacter sp. AP-Nino-20-G2 TaxID=2576917 RepID=UPI001BFD1650|nr:acyltransferase family protein [Polynucleobacter sp. AP-Nino-20-G2]QWE16958.1 acyltransferase [Polynucleobacter sp. AP-Nino-20-G2]
MTHRIGYRPDIDGLRAVALLLVVVFHAYPSYLPGGFIGVDIFFVISGFLISSILIEEISVNKFSVFDFYSRRIRRIFPALLVVLFFSLFVGWFTLFSDEYLQLGISVIAGAGFFENLLLISQLGYFDTSSDLKPLLHLWSLAVEEQFYLIWPVFIWFIYKSRFSMFKTIFIIFISSLVYNLYATIVGFENIFYSPVVRFWELLSGSFIYFIYKNKINIKKSSIQNISSILGLALIFCSAFLLNKDSKFPGWNAIPPVLGAFLIIASGNKSQFNSKILSSRPMVFIGLISYPFYLWHWPLLSFYRIIFYQKNSFIPFLIILISAILAWLTYIGIEQRIKRLKHLMPILSGMMIFASVSGGVIFINNGFPNRLASYEKYNDHPYIKDSRSTPSCIKQYSYLFKPTFDIKRDFCINYPSSEILILGDSHAEQIFDSFTVSNVQNITRLGRGSCPPIPFFNVVDSWLKCEPTVENLFNYAKEGNFKLTIFAGVFGRLFNGEYQTTQSLEEKKLNIQRFMRELGNSKITTLIILDNPKLPFQGIECLKRPFHSSPLRGCSFSRSFHEQTISTYRQIFISSAKPYPNIKILDPTNLFCNSDHCFAYNTDGLLYLLDDNHLNRRGSKLITDQVIKMYPALFNKSHMIIR